MGHQARLKPHVRIAHFTFDFRTGHQRGNGVHDHQVDRPASDQRLGNLQGLFPGVGLGHQQVVGLHPQFFRIGDIQGVFRVDERRGSTGFLRFRNGMEAQGGFP